MGAGKGKNRRVRTTVEPVQQFATLDEAKWDEFVKDSDIAGTKIFQYYLGQTMNRSLEARPPKDLAPEDWEKVSSELFQDAVSVGAIILAPPYAAEDFV